jgi:hypothetical protein
MTSENLTIPAAPRHARINPGEERAETAYFLSASELDTVVASSEALEAEASETTAYNAHVEPSTASKTVREISDTVKSRIPKLVPLSVNGRERYRMLAKYDGFIVSRDDESFIARFFEGGSDYPVMEADFNIEDISEPERYLAIPGARLTWTMSYRYEGSTAFRDSRIYVRRAEWTAGELDAARKIVAELTDGLDWEPPAPSRR